MILNPSEKALQKNVVSAELCIFLKKTHFFAEKNAFSCRKVQFLERQECGFPPCRKSETAGNRGRAFFRESRIENASLLAQDNMQYRDIMIPYSQTARRQQKYKFRFWMGGGIGAERKTCKNAAFLGKRHDNTMLKVQTWSSRNVVVIAQAPTHVASLTKRIKVSKSTSVAHHSTAFLPGVSLQIGDLVAWFARIGNWGDSCESSCRTIKLGFQLRMICANRFARIALRIARATKIGHDLETGIASDRGGQNAPNARGGGNSPRKLPLEDLDFWPPNWRFSVESL